VWRLRPALRWYAVTVTGGAVAAGLIAAALTTWRLHGLILFGTLICFGAAAMELTRRTTEPAGLVKDVHGIWQIPVALLLPPVYCLAAPVVTFVLLQLRTRRTLVHRQVFSAAASGLALAAASALFRLAHSALPGLRPGAATATLLWLAIATGCALLWSALSQGLVMHAVKLSDPAAGAGQQLFTLGALFNDLCEISAGLVLAVAIARVSWAVLIPALPLVITLQRSCRHAQLRSQARIDAKTGLLNAAAWRSEATIQFARAQRAGSPVALAIADLDHFKNVNDTHGHLAGDAVLAATAATLRRSLRSGDLLGRFGGEEFTILLPQADAADAAQVAERLRDSLAAQAMLDGRPGGPVRVTISVGVATTASPAARDLTDLLAAADAALYQAKASGRNAVRVSHLDAGHPACEPAA